jgi:hypothetical protein
VAGADAENPAECPTILHLGRRMISRQSFAIVGHACPPRPVIG